MTPTPTNHPPAPATTRRSPPGAPGHRIAPPQVARRPRPPDTHTGNPVRIDRIGTDHVTVSIRPVRDGTEILAVVARLERLIDAGYDTIDVAFEPAAIR